MELNKIYKEDCLITLSKIPDKYVNLIITSPPYNKNYYSKKSNINKLNSSKFRTIDYDNYNDNLKPELYISWQKKILKECCRILKDDGSIFYNHMDILNNHLTIHPSFVYDFNVKQVLVWNRSNTPKLDENYFYPINEWIYWIKKNKQSKTKFYRKKCVFQKSILNIKPYTKSNHPASFPLELANNFILSCSDIDDIVYDPFIGSGTTAIASIINNRNYIGSEISKNYVNIANKRIKPYLTQTKLF